MIKRLAILAALLALAGPTWPTVIEDETVQTKLHLFAAIGQASTWLKDDVSKEGAIESATLWFIIGPCRGVVRGREQEVQSALQNISLANPREPFGATELEIIGLLSRLGFEKPDPTACDVK